MRILLIVLLSSSFCTSIAQNIFTEEQFLAVVRKYHPVSRSAALNVNIAKADLLASRGAFDPLLKAANAGKDFAGINYYEQTRAELVIPTWYGIDIYAGTEKLDGSRLNNEETQGSVSYIGFSVPLLQNLVMDKRRAALQQSRIMINASEAERRALLNDLLRDAQFSYWNWWQQFHIYALVDSSLRNAEKRLQMVRTAYQLGDRPAIDTVEALTQVQLFTSEKIDAYTNLVKSQLELSAFLWREGNDSYQLPPDVSPQISDSNEQPILESLLSEITNHPELQQYRFKLSALQIERRLKFQSLLPDLDLKYNQLQKGANVFSPIKGAWFDNNYRYGITLSVPLRLSQGRGEYRKAKLKIEQTTLDQLNKQVQIQTKIRQYYTEWQQTNNQVSVQNSLVKNYTALQRGEEIRFFNGESSLFLINTREQKTLEAKQKLIETQAKNKKAFANMRWSAALNID